MFGRSVTKRGDDKELRSYFCRFCGYSFKQFVYSIDNMSDQVVCPCCNNFIRT